MASNEPWVEGGQEIADFGASVQRQLPRLLFSALRSGFFQEGKNFQKSYAQHLGRVFKTGGGKRVARSFKVYTSGKVINDLVLGVFTRWKPAKAFELGALIKPIKGRFLVFPITRRAYTSEGRIKRSWRDASDPRKFNSEKFKGLFAIRTRGGIILARNAGVSKGKRAGQLGRVTKKRGVEAVEFVFMLIRATKRSPVLRFISEFVRFAGPRGAALQGEINQVLEQFARTPTPGLGASGGAI